MFYDDRAIIHALINSYVEFQIPTTIVNKNSIF